MIVDQAPEYLIPKQKKQKKGFSFGMTTGLKVDYSNETSPYGLNNHEKAEVTVKYLKSLKILDETRPNDMEDGFINNERGFVLESMTATQLFFPEEAFKDIPSLKYFSIWVSDPSPEEILNNIDKYKFKGTFLYLTPMWLDENYYTFIRSGCSALQAIVNFLEGRPILNTILHGGRERFGRSNFDHPIDKLVYLGAEKSTTKRITCLYQKRYITNEQCYIFNNKETRVNDLLGYPLFISEDI